MKIFRKTDGAVSVFLVIILVPCLLATSLFVDLGRVELSQSMAKSASDLALNTMLTKYDYDLKDFYGLAASCQSIDEFYGVATSYFENAISSTGMSDNDVDLLLDYFQVEMDKWDGEQEEIDDFLGTEIVTAESGGQRLYIGPANDNANMANPTMIKDGIVEFMKYRAPINIVSRVASDLFFDNLKGLQGAEDTGDADADKILQDTKQAFYNEEMDFNQQAKVVYKLIQEYQGYGISETTINDWIEQLNGYEERYEKIHSKYVHDLLNTSGLATANLRRVAYSKSNYTSNTYYDYKTDEDCAETGCVPGDCNHSTEASLKSLIYQLISDMSAYNTAKQNLIDAFPDYYEGTADDDYYDVQYWVRCKDAISSPLSTLKSKAVAVLVTYGKLENCQAYLSTAEAENYNSDSAFKWKIENVAYDGNGQELTTKGHYDKVVSQFNTLYSTYINNIEVDEVSTDMYVGFMSIIERIADENMSKLSASTNMMDTGKSVEQSIKEIYDELNELDGNLEKYIGKLEDINEQLDELLVARKDYQSSFETWEKTAKETDTKLGKADLEEIGKGYPAEEEGDEAVPSVKETMAQVSETSITDMQSRVTNMMSLYSYLRTYIAGLKYNSVTIQSIDTVDEAKDAASGGISSNNITIGLTNGELRTNASDSYTFTKYGGADASVNITDNNHPDFDNDPEPELYEWMKDKGWGNEAEATDTCTKCGEKFNASECYSNPQMDYQASDDPDKNIKVDKTVCPACLYGTDEGEEEGDGYAGDAEGKEEYSGGADSPAEKDIKSDYSGKASEFPSGFTGEEAGLLSTLTGLYNVGASLVNDFGLGAADFRDTLYVTEYVFGMFTHAAFENETKYKMLLQTFEGKADGEVDENAITIGCTEEEFYKKSMSEITTLYNATSDTDTTSVGAKIDKLFNSEEVTDRWNKTLTNKIITENYAYGAEIEYILAGGTNDDNLDSMYGSIYVTRFLTNSVTGFLTFWRPHTVSDQENKLELEAKALMYDAISLAVNSATLGIIPAPLVKTVLILLEIAIETAIDLEYLQAGIPVKLIKVKDDPNWGISRELDPDAFNIQYSQYLYIFLLTALVPDGNGEKDKLDDSIYARIGDVIQANMIEFTGDDTYTLRKSITHFTFKATLAVEPLMIKLPMFGNYNTDIDDASLWNMYTISTTRGY